MFYVELVVNSDVINPMGGGGGGARVGRGRRSAVTGFSNNCDIGLRCLSLTVEVISV